MKNTFVVAGSLLACVGCSDIPEEYNDTERASFNTTGVNDDSNSIVNTTSDTTEEDSFGVLKYVDILSAEFLFIAPKKSNSSSRTSSRYNYEEETGCNDEDYDNVTGVLLPSTYHDCVVDVLFKIIETGAIEEVKYLDADNKTYTITHYPISIDNIDSNYTAFIFGLDNMNPSHCYLVNKSTGQIYDLGGEDNNCPTEQGFIKRKKIFTDNQSNMYYRYWTSGDVYNLRKVDYSNPDNITSSSYISNTENINHFIVDSFGNVVYTIWESPFRTRLRKSNGGYFNLYTGTDLLYWIGLDNNIYSFGGSEDKVEKFVFDSNNDVTIDTYSEHAQISNNEHTEILKLSEVVVFVKGGNERSINITVDNDGTFNKVEDVPLSTINSARSSDNYVYISGTDKYSNNSVLVKFDPVESSFSQMYDKGTYDIYNFNVTSDDIITFSALRMNDGKKVLGKIDNETVSIIDEYMDEEINVLEEI